MTATVVDSIVGDDVTRGDERTLDRIARAAPVMAATLREADRSVEVIVATESPVENYDWGRGSLFDEVLRSDGVELPAQVPLLESHIRSLDTTLGSIRELRREGDKIVGRAYFHDDERSLRAWGKVKGGHITDLSAGGRIGEAVEVPVGESRAIKGRTYTATTRRLRVATKWVLREGSLVPIGADPNSRVREESSMVRTTSGDNQTSHTATLNAAHEQGRLEERAAILAENAEAARSRSVSIHRRDHHRDCTVETLGVGLRLRQGLDLFSGATSAEDRRAREQAADVGERYKDMSLVDVCREALRIDGAPAPADEAEMVRAATSTASLTSIFTSSAQAEVLAEFDQHEDTTKGWVREEDVPNFKSNERIAEVSLSGLTPHTRGLAAADLIAGSDREEYQVKRYSGKAAVDEQDILSDNVGALQDLPRLIAAEAANLPRSLVYSYLLTNGRLSDGVPLFDAIHSNLLTGAGSGLSIKAVAAAVSAMSQQRQGGRSLNLRPKYLVVPSALWFTALGIVRSKTITVTGATDREVPAVNPIFDLQLEVRVDDSIGAQGTVNPMTGKIVTGSDTAWYLASDPLIGRGIVVGYLLGANRRPKVRGFTLGKGRYGVGLDITFDFGVKALNHRGLSKSTGQ